MIKSCIKWNENIRKNTIGQGDDHTIGCLFHYLYFKENYKLIPIHLSKQLALDTDLKAIQQINFNANLERAGDKIMFFITASFFIRSVRVL